ncbi:MAG: bifunctional phosphopantothenoylcysteine decarboxylase/phosphopantothenate--cysteine ligase CoaBC [Gammaproteobacteria bacterium]|nr:MAG: bifunctional phosphopantothenoylcysteine decarboxylase/phosphopantothenate--cysteine ligase CoaBC [Gammaproteobacteria bacterium]
MKILVGISGGIAAYKSPDLVRQLKKSGVEVRVAMTKAATSFISPLTLQAVSGNPVSTDLLDPEAEAGMGHIELARWADLILIAPATADLIARLAMGMANDLVSTLCLATTAPIAVAPAMNLQMWANPATQDNIKQLQQRNISILGPDTGEQACGETGLGRMLEPAQLVAECELFNNQVELTLTGKKLLITAGPTREDIDPVRYLSNYSSGKMGFALAKAAFLAGAEVTLIAGPVNIESLHSIKRINVISARDMYKAVHEQITDQDIFIGCAAVADYRVSEVAHQKIKKNDQQLVLTMVENPDIIASVTTLKNKPFCVGFAAETTDVLKYAKQKLSKKNLNMICANDVSNCEIGFNSDCNQLTVINADGQSVIFEKESKASLSRKLINLIAEQLPSTQRD